MKAVRLVWGMVYAADSAAGFVSRLDVVGLANVMEHLIAE